MGAEVSSCRSLLKASWLSSDHANDFFLLAEVGVLQSFYKIACNSLRVQETVGHLCGMLVMASWLLCLSWLGLLQCLPGRLRGLKM